MSDLDSSLRNTLFHWPSVFISISRSLPFCLFSLLKNWFLSFPTSTKTRWTFWVLPVKLPQAESDPCWTAVLSENTLGAFWKFSWPPSHFFISLISPDSSNFLNTTSWESSLFAQLSLSGPADAKLWSDVCQIVWSLAFCDWKLVFYTLAASRSWTQRTCV